MITFVVFYTKIDATTVKSIREKCATFKVPDPQRFVEMTLSSAKLFHSDGRFVLLTPETNFHLPDWIEVIPVKGLQNVPVLNRIEAEVFLLKSGIISDESHILFLDYDILINDNLFELFLLNCDVIFTYTEGILHPFNAGVRGVVGGNHEKSLLFYEQVYQNLLSKNDFQKIWFGEQEAILEVIGPGWEKYRDQVLQLENGVRVGLVPEFEYNYAPNSPECLKKPLTTNKILHFRGVRKQWMLPYWSKFLRA